MPDNLLRWLYIDTFRPNRNCLSIPNPFPHGLHRVPAFSHSKPYIQETVSVPHLSFYALLDNHLPQSGVPIMTPRQACLNQAFHLLVLASTALARTQHEPIDDGYGDSVQWRRWFQFSEDWYTQNYGFPDLWDPEDGYDGCHKKREFPYHEPHDSLLVNKLLGCYQEPDCRDPKEYKVQDGYAVVGYNKHNCSVGSFSSFFWQWFLILV